MNSFIGFVEIKYSWGECSETYNSSKKIGLHGMTFVIFFDPWGCSIMPIIAAAIQKNGLKRSARSLSDLCAISQVNGNHSLFLRKIRVFLCVFLVRKMAMLLLLRNLVAYHSWYGLVYCEYVPRLNGPPVVALLGKSASLRHTTKSHADRSYGIVTQSLKCFLFAIFMPQLRPASFQFSWDQLI